MVRVSDFRRSGMRLSASGAESWCLDNIVIPASGLPPGQQLWARLEIRSAESKEPLAANSGINLATLIEIFSRPSRPQQDRWSVESAPFHVGRSEAIAMNRLRNRLILVFVVATLAPLCLMGWISLHLLRYSLSLSSTPRVGPSLLVAQADRA